MADPKYARLATNLYYVESNEKGRPLTDEEINSLVKRLALNANIEKEAARHAIPDILSPEIVEENAVPPRNNKSSNYQRNKNTRKALARARRRGILAALNITKRMKRQKRLKMLKDIEDAKMSR